MSNILVSGGKGFIGTHVVARLEALGHAMTIIDAMESRVHGSTVTWLDAPHAKHIGDVGFTDLQDIDIVVHLAAQVGVADSMVDPFRYLRQNTFETQQMLEALKSKRPGPPRLQRLIVASSMSVYGDPKTEQPVREDHTIEPASVYGLTKFDQERLCRIWGEVEGVPTVALRFFNVYGPGQALTNPYTGVLANFANSLLKGEQPTVFEDGQQTRDFVYVDDVADAVVEAATGAQTSGTYNICTGRPTTIAQMALMLASALGVDTAPNITHSRRPGDIRHCIGNADAFAAAFGWRAAVDVPTGLTRYATELRLGAGTHPV